MKRLIFLMLPLLFMAGCAVGAALPDGLDTQPEPPISEAQSAPTPAPPPPPPPRRSRRYIGPAWA